jgi:hypothetical protein
VTGPGNGFSLFLLAQISQVFFDCLTWGDWRGLKPASA